MTYLMAKRDEGRHFVLVKDQLLTVAEVTKRHLPLTYFRLIDVDDSTVYWFFGARFTDAEDYTVIYENAHEAVDGLLHKYRYTMEIFARYVGNTNENWCCTLTQDRDVPLDGEMYRTLRAESKFYSFLKHTDSTVFITRQKRGELSKELVSYYSTNCSGLWHREIWISKTFSSEKPYTFCYHDNAPAEV